MYGILCIHWLLPLQCITAELAFMTEPDPKPGEILPMQLHFAPKSVIQIYSLGVHEISGS